jgi:uncharacterized protein YjbI with pentapeptide repeats
VDQLRGVARWRPQRPPTAAWITVLVVAGLAVLAGCVYVLPQVLVPDRSATSLAAVPDAAKRLELEDARLKQRNDVRTTLLQGLAGAVVAVGLSLTWRQIRVNQEGQITERFNKAIDHLGSDKLDLRLGGIYALERIAKNSNDDRDTIAEILTAFVRQRSPWPPSQPGQYRDDFPIDHQPELRTRAADIQAVLTVLGRGGLTRQGAMRLDLAEVDLRKAALRGAHLERVDLSRAHLERAFLIGAHLEGANLYGAHLEGNLRGAQLQGASLLRAHLEGADLRGAHLEGAQLITAQLEGANLYGAQLEGAILSGAHLERANLYKAHLEGADLSRAQLQGANLHDAHLEGLNLSETHLGDADLRGAHLEGANLFRADLEAADLRGARLGGADLSGARLGGADLRGAQLQRAHLLGAHLEGAIADTGTAWPDDFDTAAKGIAIREGSPGATRDTKLRGTPDTPPP